MTQNELSPQDIAKIRAETKGTSKKVHFNNAGASLPPDCVVETVIEYLKEEAVSGGYEMEAHQKERIEQVYQAIGKLSNASPEEIAITENASTAWGLAFHGIGLQPGDEVIVSEVEYVSNLLGLQHGEKDHGIKVIIIANDEHGNFSLPDCERAINHKTKLIAITHIASSAGGMMPIVEIGEIAKKHNILYLVDGCQSVGHVPIDVKQINCDMFSVTGRKYLRGPRGTGFLYVRKETLNKVKPLFMDQRSIDWITLDDYRLRDDAKRYELFEKNRALSLGLGKAVEYALHVGPDRIWRRIQQLASLLRSRLRVIDTVTVHDSGAHQCGIVTFSLKTVDSAIVQRRLAERNVNVSVAVATSTLIFMDRNRLSSIVRASVHYYNTEEEIETLCGLLAGMVEECARIAVV